MICRQLGQKNGKQQYKVGADATTNGFIDKILKKGGPGAAGIASFEWQSQGKNEGNLTLYKAKIKFVLQTIEEMTKVRGSSYQKEITLLDLLYPGVSNSSVASAEGSESYNLRDSIIRAVVGWHIPDKYQNSKAYFETTLTLSMYDHTFNFLDNGKIELEVNFSAGIESMIYDKTRLNVLSNEETQTIINDLAILQEINFVGPSFRPDLLNKVSIITNKDIPDSATEFSGGWVKGLSEIAKKEGLQIDPLMAGGQGIFTREHRDKLVEKLQEKFRENNRSVLISILEKLVVDRKIYSLNLDEKYFELLKAYISVANMSEEKWKKFSQKLSNPGNVTAPRINPGAIKNLFENGFVRKITNGEQILDTDAITGEINGDKWYNLYNAFDGTRKIPFIYLGDLLETVVSQVFKDNNNIDLFFSPFTYIDYQQSLQKDFSVVYQSSNDNGSITKKMNTNNLVRKTSSLMNIPISIGALFSWFEERVASKEEKSMSFGSFLDSVFYHLIPMSIGSVAAPNAPKQNIVITRKYFQTPRKITTNSIIDIKDLAKKYNSRSKELNSSGAYLNFYFGAIKQHSTANLSGNIEEDTKRKIFHLYTSSTNGFVKNIKFKRPDNPLLVTDNLISSMDASNNEYIRHPYNATITMFGNNFFEPGSLVYIVPNYMGTNLQHNTFFKIGLGGYYRISQINSSIGLGGYETVIEATWETWPK